MMMTDGAERTNRGPVKVPRWTESLTWLLISVTVRHLSATLTRFWVWTDYSEQHSQSIVNPFAEVNVNFVSSLSTRFKPRVGRG